MEEKLNEMHERKKKWRRYFKITFTHYFTWMNKVNQWVYLMIHEAKVWLKKKNIDTYVWKLKRKFCVFF